jgi:4-hydroxythreonine-4-phosphate dehydrogenase
VTEPSARTLAASEHGTGTTGDPGGARSHERASGVSRDDGRPPRLAITLGDPRGIGPEIVAATLADAELRALCEPVVVGPTGTVAPVQECVGEWSGGGAEEAGRLAGRAIERAVALASGGAVEGIVTAPIDKAALLIGGYDYPGHTEMLAALTGSRTAMMLASARLRVVLATTHLALRHVPDAVTPEAIVEAATITREYLRRWFGLADPRIALCALNPHAGDGGRFGAEDDVILAPAARAAGIAGPFPADTVFVRAMRGAFDAVIAPYHDVGMTAIKVASFGEAVNVTLGLPFPRCSPDHGTALDIAGQGIADPSSFAVALRTCAEIALWVRGATSGA